MEDQREDSAHRNVVRAPAFNVLRIPADDSIWCGDSGAGDHMTCHGEWFKTYTELPPHSIEVILCDDHTLDVHGIGSIKIYSEHKIYRLERVLFVPNLRRKFVEFG